MNLKSLSYLSAIAAAGCIQAHAQGTAFAYQGRLDTAGVPTNGTNDLTFTLFDAATGGFRVGETNRFNDIGISNGLFTVTLDFGSAAFNGSPRWLQIGVRPGTSTGAYTELAPRQPVTATPNAIFAGFANSANAAGLAGTLPSSVLRGVNGSGLTSLTASNLTTGTVPDARLSPNVALRNGGNTFNGNQVFSTGNVGIGTANPQTPLDVNGVVQLQAIELRAVDSTPYLDFSSEAGVDFNARIIYGGRNDNTLYYNAARQVFSGGNVEVSGDITVGNSRAISSTGRLHVQSTSGQPLFLNPFPGSGEVVVGGGGTNQNLQVTGDITVGNSRNISSTGRLHVQSTSGQPLFLNPFAGSGEVVVGGGGVNQNLHVTGEITTTAINLTSDRNAKEGFKPVNVREVLDKVTRLPISEWQYKQQTDVRHMGPVAQDFREAFALGRDEKHISSVDADGVALAAIQGLNEVVREKDAEIEALKAENSAVVKRLEAIEKALGLQTGAARSKR
jgi:hypothetical protein